MSKAFILVTAFGFFFIGCGINGQNGSIARSVDLGVLKVKTQFYDTSGNSEFLGWIKIWYKDSIAIEEIVTTKSVTDTSHRTVVSYIPQFYRYIDLKANSWYDYKTFSDTARIVKCGALPDSLFDGYGWTFYANHLPIKGQPEVLPDTTIGSIKYRRIKFSRLKKGLYDSFFIGYLRCDNKGRLFSLEKDFSSKINCTMTRFYEFKEGASHPFASNELEFLSDTLSQKELRIFDAWKKNQLKFPVN